VSEPSLPEKILALHRGLAGAKIAHAFGGALALAYYAEPRTTIDVDVNVFLAPARYSAVQTVLTPLGAEPLDVCTVERDGQCRTNWGRTPIDLFFAYDEIHDAMRREARLVPFGDDRLPILSPEHLLVCKALFDRPKDWLDIEQMLICTPNLDTGEVRSWLCRALGEDDPRDERFEELAGRLVGAPVDSESD
jgi:hypothetical protein